ncbi:MAG TPA: DNA-binding response regulator [Firmicutes bacterium]|nr:DNA-binding response regulator [Bacillota bacterium]
MKKIMIVEDDEVIKDELSELLKNSSYLVESVKNFEKAKEEIFKYNPDLILLDINIPYLNGELLLKEIRKESSVPVIMVTSKSGEIDEALSITYGADDYITKPYNPTILLLRIQNIFKRINQNNNALKYKDIIVDLNKSELKKDDKVLVLTKNEMIIFSYLLNNKEKIVSRDELMTYLWNNEEYINDNALTVNISRLRSKLSNFGYENIIETRKGQGYILI